MDLQLEHDVEHPASWWEGRSAQQLQEFVRAGFMSGELYSGAQREIERRARESLRQVDEAARIETAHRKHQSNQVAFSAAGIGLVAAIGALIWLFLR